MTSGTPFAGIATAGCCWIGLDEGEGAEEAERIGVEATVNVKGDVAGPLPTAGTEPTCFSESSLGLGHGRPPAAEPDCVA